MQKLYFPNLNGLRFIAALMVILHHVEQSKSIYGYANHWDNPFVRVVGKLGVILFFVLSGFLITYLLLQEKSDTKTVSVKSFYKRRILRIWPLYYFVLTLALVALPLFRALDLPASPGHVERHVTLRAILFLLFMPNLAYAAFGGLPYVTQAWSVGVEEQFYFIWPFLVKTVRGTLTMLLGVILAYIVMNYVILYVPGIDRIRWVASSVWADFSIDCMAIGGLAAWLLHQQKKRALSILFNRYVQLAVYAVTITLILLGFRSPLFHYEFYALLFAFIILNCAANEHSILNLENRPLNYLGKISYGIYMYHPLAIVVALKLLARVPLTNSFLVCFASTCLTVLIASASYHLLERPFIRMKLRYSTIISGDNVSAVAANDMRPLTPLPVAPDSRL